MARFVTIPIGPIFSSGPCRGIIHVVEKGDTLYKLGQQYHVSVSRIMYANPYVNIYNLQVGDELCIPVGPQPRTEQSETDFPQRMEMPEDMNVSGRMSMPEDMNISGRMSMPEDMNVSGRMSMPERMDVPERMNLSEGFSEKI